MTPERAGLTSGPYVFEGHASLFGVRDSSGDRVERGAFAASLARRGVAGVRMLFQHDPARPLGRWLTIREDALGLFVRGEFASGAASASDVLGLVAGRAVDGLSIGFRTIRAERAPGSSIRRIIEADLWEISIVTFPMLAGARIRSTHQGHGA